MTFFSPLYRIVPLSHNNSTCVLAKKIMWVYRVISCSTQIYTHFTCVPYKSPHLKLKPLNFLLLLHFSLSGFFAFPLGGCLVPKAAGRRLFIVSLMALASWNSQRRLGSFSCILALGNVFYSHTLKNNWEL